MPNAVRAASLGLVSSSLLMLGCGTRPEPREHVLQTSEPIKGGYTDTKDTNVVGVIDNNQGAECSGSLLGPNLVLTARHCVAAILNGTNGVDCNVTKFATPYPPSHFYVTTRGSFSNNPTDYHSVKQVRVPTSNPLLCGQDQAILILSSKISTQEALPPLVPRVDTELMTGEGYYAIGYGATSNQNLNSAGTRRRLDNLVIKCAGGKCTGWGAVPKEWAGDHGICEGDSGGPALDMLGRVIGVTSRGLNDCSGPIYGDVYGWADWIKQAAIDAAAMGGYQPPPWAMGFPTDPAYSAPIGQPCAQPSDCPTNACLDGYCTRPCNDVAVCDDGYECDASLGNVCAQIPPNDGSTSGGDTSGGAVADDQSSGCSMTGTTSRGSYAWVLAACAIALGAVRRRKR